MDAFEKYDTCVAALRTFAHQAGFTECVIGLSGGIDSALCAVLCVDAFGASSVHGVLLPGPYSSAHSVEDAEDEARMLGIDYQVLSIVEPYQAFAELLAEPCGKAWDNLPSQNTQARCRMVCLMALSNTHGWMLVNTGNKSEAMMGYSTLYGDTAGAFAPIGGLYKTDVYALSRARNERARTADLPEPIPARVLVKPPSAELTPGQEDESSLGIDYATLDAILIRYFEWGWEVERIASEGLSGSKDVSEVRQIIERAQRFAFKRALEPPYPSARFYD